MLRGRHVTDGLEDINSFSYKTTMLSPVITLTWNGRIAVFEKPIAEFLVSKKYARNLDHDEVDWYNEAVSRGTEFVEETSEVTSEMISDDKQTVESYSTQANEHKKRGRKPKNATIVNYNLEESI